VEAGHSVIAVTMRTFCYGEGQEGERSCCGLEGIADARAVAQVFGVPHHVVDVEELFRQRVIDDFVSQYARGRTPNPCIRCNTHVKFPALLERFRALGVEAIASGHHARTRGEGTERRLLRGVDRAKDQSYVLWGLSLELLARALFPIGHMTKAEIRRRAQELGLSTAEKPESQEICFVPPGKHAQFVGMRRPEALHSGPIMGPSGQRIGTHHGIAGFTVGQRRGIGVAAQRPLYVKAIDAAERAIHVDYREALRVDRCWLEGVNRLAPLPASGRISGLHLQVRAHQKPWPATMVLESDGSVQVEIAAPAEGIAPGQSAVLYDATDQVVMLGGIIERTALRCPATRES
jgi:tRNA-specific 2-thiouridylase